MGWFDIIQADLMDYDKLDVSNAIFNTSDGIKRLCTKLYIVRLLTLGITPSDFPIWLKEFNG